MGVLFPSTMLCFMLLKAVLLLGIIWANYVSYTSPNPKDTTSSGTKSARAGYSSVNMRPPWARLVSKMVIRGMVIMEIIALWANSFAPSTSQISFTLSQTIASLIPPNIRLSPVFLIGWALAMIGGATRLACYRTMGKNFTFEVTIRKGHNLTTSGPYSVVRHPSYTAMCLVVAGEILCFCSPGSWLTESGVLNHRGGQAFALVWLADLIYVPCVMVFSRVRMEDEMMRKTFGREWEEWARRTPYALFPGVF